MQRCDGVTRREFLRVGSISALGLSLTDVLRLRGEAAGKNFPNCILVWLDGGPSHLDTFDLKPDTPAEIRGPFKPVDTNVSGIRICEEFNGLTKHMDKVCLIRSMTSPLGEHNFGRHYLLTGYKPSPVLQYPSFGSVVAHCRENPSQLPSYIAVPNYSPQAANGYLPGATRPFAVLGDPSKPDFKVKDLDPPGGLTADRLDRRSDFLKDLDNLSRQVESNAIRKERDAQFEQAYRLILSPAAKKAFDLRKESPDVRQKYGRQKLGQSCLLARRLVEAGCPFVTVTDTGWDTHTNISLRLRDGYTGARPGRYNGKIPQLDKALSALLTDLSQRGLLDETLVMVMGEFGRTPKLNTAGGRDHWPRAFSVLLAGGGIKGGQVVGTSDPRGESADQNVVTPTDLARTVYTVLGIDPDREFHTADSRPVLVSPGGKVIKECLG